MYKYWLHKNHWIVCFKGVNFILNESSLNLKRKIIHNDLLSIQKRERESEEEESERKESNKVSVTTVKSRNDIIPGGWPILRVHQHQHSYLLPFPSLTHRPHTWPIGCILQTMCVFCCLPGFTDNMFLPRWFYLFFSVSLSASSWAPSDLCTPPSTQSSRVTELGALLDRYLDTIPIWLYVHLSHCTCHIFCGCLFMTPAWLLFIFQSHCQT